MTPVHLLAIGFAAAAAQPAPAPAPDQQFPRVETVAAQPLLAQVRRLVETLEFLGEPLPAPAAEALARIARDPAPHDDPDLAARVQAVLDPLCVLAVERAPDGAVRVAAAPPGAGPELVEQGWRSVLLKVVNRARTPGRLRVDSPNARPLPNAPADEVPSLWLDLEHYEGRPMTPALSGLELEYRVLRLYAREAGSREATLRVRFDPLGDDHPDSPLVRQWTFARDLDGWKPANNIRLRVERGALVAEATDFDPFMIADVAAPAAPMTLRFWARVENPGVGQIFWWTDKRPWPSGDHRVDFVLKPGREALYEIPFTPEDDLRGVRVDPGNDPGLARFDWIELSRDVEPAASVILPLRVAPSVPLVFRIKDGDLPQHLLMACFEIRDDRGRVYPAQGKRLAPDFFFQPQVYRGPGESVRLPAGTYSVLCSRGPESVPETKTVVIPPGAESVLLEYEVRRWVDPSLRGWWSGDHHIHAAGCLHYEKPTEGVHPPDMFRHILGEDLKVGCCLTWGPCFDYQKRFFTGETATESRPPHLLRYDVEVSGFGSHVSGHLCLLNLTEQIYPGGESKDHWPTLGLNTLRWAKRQGAVCGPAHSAIGLTRIVDRVPGAEGRDGPNRLPNYDVPAFDGIGANEFIMNVPHELPGPDGRPLPAIDFISTMNTDRVAEWNIWYHTLNAGFRVRASGETDFPCITGERVGFGRVYAKVEVPPGGNLEYQPWVRAIADGRSYVSDGRAHILDFRAETLDDQQPRTVELGVDGGELRLPSRHDAPRKVRFRAEVALAPDVPSPGASRTLELVVNGFPRASRQIPADGRLREVAFDVEIEKSSWAALRVFPAAHTNPVFVILDDAPIRASRLSALWCLMSLERCRQSKMPSYAPEELEDARAAYDHARDVYQRILEESPDGT